VTGCYPPFNLVNCRLGVAAKIDIFQMLNGLRLSGFDRPAIVSLAKLPAVLTKAGGSSGPDKGKSAPGKPDSY